MTSYAHEQMDAALKALEASASDNEIANLLADYFTNSYAAPFTFSINHNGRAAPCPVKIDKVMAKACIVKLPTATRAKAWIVEALLRGYEVTGGTYKGHETRSIADERREIEYRAQMATWRARRNPSSRDDDDIPF